MDPWWRNGIVIALSLLLGLAIAVYPAPAISQLQEAPEIRGKNLFKRTCVFCHAKGGRKAGKGPKLANSRRSDEYMFKRIFAGKRSRMPGFGKAFSDAEIRAIIAYIRSLDDK